MPQFPKSPFLVPFDGSFRVKKAHNAPPKGAPDKPDAELRLAQCVDEIAHLQKKLYADNRHSVLLVFQAIDAAGKDGTIRAVLTGTNPAACQVQSFKSPSEEELDHDFLWRIARALPERGMIGVFNRSHYEEVLTVRVHPEFLERQRLPSMPPLPKLWKERYESIRDFEKHLARNGTVILKFWLNVSRKEQKKRLLARIDDASANWKFQPSDIDEREQWTKYMSGYEDILNETSRPWAPWYAIPADDKPFMRWAVADIVARTMKNMDIDYPKLSTGEVKKLKLMRSRLEKS
ncbi:polyphosphate kinase 2 family protein [Pendulispora brunnea]|uniref:Polyphosphate kinase 2 family protein n=1 Tax=Pendulispora brunnea TaxID=2905690 RepID=A0ABZ2KEN6_9BACT